MKILVVSSDEGRLEWLEKSLNRHGHEVIIAADGDQAFKLWDKFRPFEVVLTDAAYRNVAWIGDRLVEVEIEFLANEYTRIVRDAAHLIELIRAVDPSQPLILASSSSVEPPQGVALLRMPCSIKRLLLAVAGAHRQRLPLFPFDSVSP